jgi:Domain of unknown function (DUF6378)
MPLPSDSPRAEILDYAKELICGDRNVQYGEPTADFDRSAQILNAQGYSGPGGRPIKMHDVALIGIAIKLSRLVWTPGKKDHWADIAGYAACGYECITEEEKRAKSDAHRMRNRLRARLWRWGR